METLRPCGRTAAFSEGHAETRLLEYLGRLCGQRQGGRKDQGFVIEDYSKPHDFVAGTDGSVSIDQSERGLHRTVKRAIGATTVHECSIAGEVTTPSLTMGMAAVIPSYSPQDYLKKGQPDHMSSHATIPFTHAINFATKYQKRKVEQAVQTGMWQCTASISKDPLWTYCPGHAGVKGKDGADRLAIKHFLPGDRALWRPSQENQYLWINEGSPEN